MTPPFPRDDFDAVAPPRDGRRGAHRAAPRRAHGFAAPLVIAAVVAVAGGAGATGWFALGPSARSTAAASPTAGAAAAAAAGADEAAADAPADAAGAPSADAAGADAAASAEVDRSAPVVVLNGTGTKGLAATTATTLETAGWTVSSTGNATSAQRSALTATTVLYPDAALEAPAAALATAVGGTAALDDDAGAGALTVVLR